MHKGRDVPTSQWNVLDTRSDDIAFCDRDHVRDTISTIDDRTRQRPLLHVLRRPGRRQRQHGLDRNIQTRHVERLEHDLGRQFPVLGRVERRFC